MAPPEPSHAAVREALSAHLDGEDDGPLGVDVLAHLRGCADCRAWQEGAHQLTRRTRLAPAVAERDRSEELVAAVLADRTPAAPRGRRLARAGLVAAAVGQVAVVLPALAVGGHLSTAHASRELAAFNLALAIGFLVVAWRPRLARGSLPVAGAATALLLAVSVVDSVLGETTVAAELPHLALVVGVAALGWLTRQARGSAPPSETSAVPRSSSSSAS